MYWSHAATEPLLSALVAMAKLCPPRLEVPGPVRPGSGAVANLPTILDEPSSLFASA